MLSGRILENVCMSEKKKKWLQHSIKAGLKECETVVVEKLSF